MKELAVTRNPGVEVGGRHWRAQELTHALQAYMRRHGECITDPPDNWHYVPPDLLRHEYNLYGV